MICFMTCLSVPHSEILLQSTIQKYGHAYECICCHKMNPSWQSSLEVDQRSMQITVDTDLLKYLLEEFCHSAKATQH